MTFWTRDTLTFEDFSLLQDFITDASKPLKDVVLNEFIEGGLLAQYDPEKPIDYAGYCVFMSAYLGIAFPESVRDKLFLSFMRRSSTPAIAPTNSKPGLSGKSAALMAAGQTLCAPVTGSVSHQELSSLAVSPSTQQSKCHGTSSGAGGLLAGLTEKLHHMGHHHHHSSGAQQTNMMSSFSAQSHPSLIMQSGDDPTEALHSRSSSKKSAHSVHSLHLGAHHKVDVEVVWRPRDVNDASGGKENTGAGTEKEKICFTESDTIDMKDLLCYLSLLESGRPADKLEFMFRLYDTDGNGVLDKSEIECIINQMMNVANYLNWDTEELRPILQDMMNEIDYDADGEVTLEEWKRGGLTNVPLLVLLGLDTNVRDDGKHTWRLKHFSRPAHCNLCHKMLVGFGKQGLCCVFCRYTVHERCAQNAPTNCISTYTKCRKTDQTLETEHHWTELIYPAKCIKCKKTTKMGDKIGFHCRWCKNTLHKSCIANWKKVCDIGELREHILPPTAIFPAVLERKPTSKRNQSNSEDYGEEVVEEEDAKSPTSNAPSSECEPISSQTSSFQIYPPSNCHPILVFINPKSGGKQGARILKKLQYLLNPRQVYDLMRDGGPNQGLQFFKDVKGFRLLVCGGDGTVGWLLEAMDKYDYGDERPPVSVLPLGTGNDLARCLRWGGGYEGESLEKIMSRISQGTVILLDRWQIECSEPPRRRVSRSGDKAVAEGDEDDEENMGDEMPCNIINNYFSIGVDASIAHRFHMMREKHPEKFSSRMRNRIFYMELGTSEVMTATCKNLHEHVDIICDGVALDLRNGTPLEGIAILNIPSVYGGSNLWGLNSGQKKRKKLQHKNKKKKTDRDMREPSKENSSFGSENLAYAVQDMGDRLIEVVGLENAMHAGLVAGGFRSSGKRLAQCREVVVRTQKRFPMQIDGEPWVQTPCTLSITHKNQVPMIMAPSNKRSGVLGLFSRR